MTLIDRFLAEHPFFCALLEHERRILVHYLELYRCPKDSYLVLPNELQEVLWIVVRGRLAEYSRKNGPDSDAPSDLAPAHNVESDVQDDMEDNGTDNGEGLSNRASAESNQAATESYSDRHNNSPASEAEMAHPSEPHPSEAPPSGAEAEAGQPLPEQKRLLRYFFSGDLVNVHALTQELIAQNEIVSLEDETQVICITAFHLAKLAQQQPGIHRALRPVYNADGYLISGLPLPVWQQMNDVPPPHTRDLGKQWLQRRPLIRSYNSWHSSIVAFFVLVTANIWQFRELYWETVPLLNIILAFVSLPVLVVFIMRRYRCEYTLKHSLLHITERGLFGLSSKIKSYPLLSIREAELIIIPVITHLFQVGGLRIFTYPGEIIQIFPIDRVHKWLEVFQDSLRNARKLQEQMQYKETVSQFRKWNKLQVELIKDINYRSAEHEGKLPGSLRALMLQILPVFSLGLAALYYSLRSELLRIYLTVPLIALVLVMIFQLVRWLRYTWRINEECLFCQDNFLGHRYNHKILIRDIRNVHLEYLNILGLGTISLMIDDRVIRLQNLKNPQSILDEIESLRHRAKSPVSGSGTDDFLTHKQLEMYHDFNRSHLPK
ncbi:hypothetical protein P0082_07270 [Candidatus Haliotispira prima]|uniref:PH domain-containing protein n=1 Tax=Candidatus Haliotispira prima TaxID=3034016 RepID=A0ABY8MEA0_9SPIO|nr:hypothetical protein P0082_07270 [Candidatus Haliotispira prima]